MTLFRWKTWLHQTCRQTPFLSARSPVPAAGPERVASRSNRRRRTSPTPRHANSRSMSKRMLKKVYISGQQRRLENASQGETEERSLLACPPCIQAGMCTTRYFSPRSVCQPDKKVRDSLLDDGAEPLQSSEQFDRVCDCSTSILTLCTRHAASRRSSVPSGQKHERLQAYVTVIEVLGSGTRGYRATLRRCQKQSETTLDRSKSLWASVRSVLPCLVSAQHLLTASHTFSKWTGGGSRLSSTDAPEGRWKSS